MRDEIADRIGWWLVVIAVPLLLAGMFGLNGRLMLIASAVAIVGVIVRIARL